MVGVPARRAGWVSRNGGNHWQDLVCPRTGEAYRETADGKLEPGAEWFLSGYKVSSQQHCLSSTWARNVAAIGAAIDRAILDVVNHGSFIMGPEVPP